jgi:hypothetical protein
MDTSSQTPWGWPATPVVVSAWVAAYAPWLLIGGLIVLGFATAGRGRK